MNDEQTEKLLNEVRKANDQLQLIQKTVAHNNELQYKIISYLQYITGAVFAVLIALAMIYKML